MKKLINKVLPVLLLLTAIMIIGSSCLNDDEPSKEQEKCKYEGFSSNIATPYDLIPEADLLSGYITGGSNGPEIEIRLDSNPGDFNFTTTAVNENATGTGTLNYGGNTYTVNVVCNKGVTGVTGALVGDEFRFHITHANFTGDFCVIQDILTLGYIDADGDGCGSQTVSYTTGVLNNLDTDDTDPNVCM